MSESGFPEIGFRLTVKVTDGDIIEKMIPLMAERLMHELRHVATLCGPKNRKCGSKVAAETGYFKPFFHLILHAQQPDRS